ncbi:MAG: hypothetical protein ACOYMN_14260 [Roseimicrobium sp.]
MSRGPTPREVGLIAGDDAVSGASFCGDALHRVFQIGKADGEGAAGVMVAHGGNRDILKKALKSHLCALLAK